MDTGHLAREIFAEEDIHTDFSGTHGLLGGGWEDSLPILTFVQTTHQSCHWRLKDLANAKQGADSYRPASLDLLPMAR